MDKIKVLLVDDNDQTRDGTRRLLEYEDDIEIIDFAENGQVALQKAEQHKPDVILMDINMPVMDGLEATQKLQDILPRAQVIIVSVQDDPNYMREAIRAGAVDFVAKPISSEELSEAIRRAYSKIPPPEAAPVKGPAVPGPGQEPRGGKEDSKIITVLGPKGGVGKTTVAVNLAIGLAQEEPDKDILIVDCNTYFGDVGVFLNTRGQHSIVDMAVMAEVPEDIDAEAVDQIVVPHESGVHLLVAPPNLEDVGAVTMTQIVNMLDYFRTRYDYIIVDTAVSFDDILVGAIQAADRLLMVTIPIMPALKDSRLMFGELTSAEYVKENVILVLNHVKKDGRITADQIGNFLHHEVASQIPEDSAADEAVNRGVPIITLDARRVDAVRPLTDLVKLVKSSLEAKEEEQLEEKEQRGGLFGRR